MRFLLPEELEAVGQLPGVRFSTLLQNVLRDHVGLFPPSIDLARTSTVLDVAARSGQWARTVART